MTDPQPQQQVDEKNPEQDQELDEKQEQAEETTAQPAVSTKDQPTAPTAEQPASTSTQQHGPTPEGQTSPATDGAQTGAPEAAGQNLSKKSLLLGFVAGAVAVLIVIALAAYVWPGFLAGPGKPDAKAAEAAAALGSKNPAALDKITCHGPDGKPSSQMIPPQALQLIQGVTQTGPPQLSLDTQALAPVDLTLSAQGQTQKLSAALALTVSNGQWCMNGLAQRQ